MAFVLFQSLLVLQLNLAAAGEPRLQQDQRAVGVDRQCLGLFLDGFSLSVGTANADGDLHQYALTAPSSSCICRRICDLSHCQPHSLNYTPEGSNVERREWPRIQIC